MSSGCASRNGIQLATPKSVTAVSDWSAAVDKAISGMKIGVPTDDKGKRDAAIAYSTALVMTQYGTVRTSLMQGRALSSIAFDVLDLGITSGVPITNGTRGKTILGALATGFKGTQLSIDRNLFNQQTTSAILTAMDTCVLRQRKLLDTKRASLVADYSLYDAYSDLVSLYGCTTLAGAMEELVETQSVAARAEKDKGTVAPVTKEEVEDFTAAQAAFSASVAAADKKTALDFLTEMGNSKLTKDSKPEEFYAAYRPIHQLAINDVDARKKFFAAARKVGLIK